MGRYNYRRIAIKYDTAKALIRIKLPGDSYDKVIQRLMRNARK